MNTYASEKTALGGLLYLINFTSDYSFYQNLILWLWRILKSYVLDPMMYPRWWRPAGKHFIKLFSNIFLNSVYLIIFTFIF